MARVLAIDPGTRRCGVAISDSARTMAFPREALSSDGVTAAVVRLVSDEGVDLVVVGRPVALSGSETASTAVADELLMELREGLGAVPVVALDERLTTTEAQRSMRQAGVTSREHRGRLDSAAAVVMLQSYLESTTDE
ncbi:MAG TPA: Holliday junction resolvase RuvX [Acidimicrobiales bacterium]|nr:Holliday junction resolvase RuvX [Acidimicrobiales bacterium]